MECRIRLEITFLLLRFFNSCLFDLFCFRKHILLLNSETSIRQDLSIPRPRPSFLEYPLPFIPQRFELVRHLFLMLSCCLIIDISQKFLMIWGNNFPFKLAEILEMTIGRRKEKSLCSCIRIGSESILPEAVHFFAKVIDRQAIGFNLPRKVLFRFIGLLK